MQDQKLSWLSTGPEVRSRWDSQKLTNTKDDPKLVAGSVRMRNSVDWVRVLAVRSRQDSLEKERFKTWLHIRQDEKLSWLSTSSEVRAWWNRYSYLHVEFNGPQNGSLFIALPNGWTYILKTIMLCYSWRMYETARPCVVWLLVWLMSTYILSQDSQDEKLRWLSTNPGWETQLIEYESFSWSMYEYSVPT